MGIWKAIPVSINILSCAGINTLVGLYKSKPTDFGVAHVAIHAVSNSFMQGSVYGFHICHFLVMLYFTQLTCSFHLNTAEYLVTCITF